MKTRIQNSIALLALAALAACGGEPGTDTAAGGSAAAGRAGTVTLTGAGATFPYPIYSKWFSDYAAANPVRVNYQSIGSGGGIRQITEGTVDFGASDAPMTEEEQARAPDVLHLPTVLGAVAVAYNLPGLEQPVRLSGDVLADVFLGQITRWNDPRIAALNPGVQLPARDILVVYRTDGSGTTHVFTDYLSSVSPGWQQRVGTAKAVSWPVGLGAKGNEGVAGQIRQTEGAIGYVEVAYALQTGLQAAALRNAAGDFVEPTVDATTAAAAGVGAQVAETGDFRVSLVNSPGAGAYPIVSWTYLLVPSHIEDCTKARALEGVIRWALTAGGDDARELHYAPLPDAVRERVFETLGTLTCGTAREPVVTGG